MNRTLRTLGMVVLAGCSIHWASAREWTVDGTTKIQAEFSGVVADTVFLRMIDGKRVKYPSASLSDQDREFIRGSKKGSVSVVHTVKSPATAGSVAASAVENSLAGRLVTRGARGFEEFNLGKSKLDYIGVYYSAGWCGPCHRFTPKLVDFYRQMKERHDNFEIVFVSNDRSEREMMDYMHDLSMPWPALRYSSLKSSPEITKYAGTGIPCLVILDGSGRILANSFEGGKYLGAEAPMNELGRLLERGK